MSNEDLRFPSGIAVAQAKKDAKRLAEERGIRLHAAQNIIAARHTGEPIWARAIEKLRAARDAAILHLNVPLSREQHPEEADRHIKIGGRASTIVILGMTGTGKSVLAMLLARQALEGGAPVVHYFSGDRTLAMLRPGNPGFERDSALCLLAGLCDQYRDAVFTHEMKHESSPPEAVNTLPNGSMVIVDDAGFVRGGETRIVDWMRWASEHRSSLVVVSECAEDVFPHVSQGRQHPATKYIGAIFMGKMKRGVRFENEPREVQAVVEATQLLSYGSDGWWDFIVATTNPAWVGVARHKALSTK